MGLTNAHDLVKEDAENTRTSMINIYRYLTRFHLALFENLRTKGCLISHTGGAIALCIDEIVTNASDLRHFLEERNHTELGDDDDEDNISSGLSDRKLYRIEGCEARTNMWGHSDQGR